VTTVAIAGPLPSLSWTSAPATGAPSAVTRASRLTRRASRMRGTGSPARHAASAGNTCGASSRSCCCGSLDAGSRNAPSSSLTATAGIKLPASCRTTRTPAIGAP
jgi:hypothetical protein